MAFEIELKVRVDHPDKVLNILRGLAVFHSEYEKQDTYYNVPATRFGGGGDIRVRNENGKTIVTRKEKKVVDGLEENREVEFLVSDQAPFLDFLFFIGCTRRVEKLKKGRRFILGDISLELSEVPPLGWFLEIEKLIESREPAEVALARNEVLKILGDIGITEDKIETRYYTDMLEERGDV